MKTFYVLIVKEESDSREFQECHRSIGGRSKSYETRAEAENKAAEYIRSGRSDKYFVMECVGEVRKKPCDIEVENYGREI